jgi:hypothetical protein
MGPTSNALAIRQAKEKDIAKAPHRESDEKEEEGEVHHGMDGSGVIHLQSFTMSW